MAHAPIDCRKRAELIRQNTSDSVGAASRFFPKEDGASTLDVRLRSAATSASAAIQSSVRPLLTGPLQFFASIVTFLVGNNVANARWQRRLSDERERLERLVDDAVREVSSAESRLEQSANELVLERRAHCVSGKG